MIFLTPLSFSQNLKVTNVYIPKSSSLPAIYQKEIIRVFFHNSKFRIKPFIQSKSTNSENKLFEYYEQAGSIFLKFNDEIKSIRNTSSINKNQRAIRFMAFELVHGKVALKLKKKNKSFLKNLKKPKKVKIKKIAKVIQTQKVKEEKDSKPKRIKSQIKSEPKNYFFTLGLNQYLDNNTNDYPEETKRSLSTEIGMGLDQYILTYEYKFQNLVIGSQKVLDIKSHILNFKHKVYQTKIKDVEAKINLKYSLGSMTYKKLDQGNINSQSYSLGSEVVFNSLFKFGIQYEKVPEVKSLNSLISVFVGIGWNI
jgi:hypothetical protein